jgi:CopG family nickel-responsive transcriptional regulator
MMAQLVRFGVSMDAELLAAFDGLIHRKGYANRSEAIRDLVRDALVQSEWDEDTAPAAAALCLVYDHHTPDLTARLTRIQHEFAESIVSTLHVHLGRRDCLEVIILRGMPGHLQRVADRLISARGVKHGRLVATTSGEGIT